MALEVIGAGFGRTGTASLKVALEQLGYDKCYHMAEVLENPPATIPHWLDAVSGKPDWETLFNGYKAGVDWPVCSFWKELSAFYPEAKFVLSVRDAEDWFNSVHSTIMSPDFRAFLANNPFGALNKAVVWDYLGVDLDDKDAMVARFNAHVAEVKAGLPADRLLVFNVKQGWGPLCDFLGKRLPEGDFPRVNSRDETRALIGKLMGSADEDEFTDVGKDDVGKMFES